MAINKDLQARVHHALEEAMGLYTSKNRGYGDIWTELGLKGIYGNIHGKMHLMKRGMWDGEMPDSSGAGTAGNWRVKLRDVLMDMIVYCAMAIALIDSKET